MESMGIFESTKRKGTSSTTSSKSFKTISSKSSKKSKKFKKNNNIDEIDDDDDEINNEIDKFNPGRGSILVSVVESRAREICICKIDTSESSLMEVFLIIDGHSYNETILLLQDIHPDEILLHDASRNKILSNKIEEEFNSSSYSNTRILYISRQYFDQDRGAEMLKRITAGNKIDSDIIAKYIVLSASYCLLKYIENCNGKEYAENSIRIRFDNNKSEKMMIDRRTTINLELIINSKTGEQKDSLFGVINYTKTSVGERLLKRNILNPLLSIDSIQCRLDVVEIFLRNNQIFNEISETLVKFPDLDRMLNGLTYVAKNITDNTARYGIDTLIFIKHSLSLAEDLNKILKKLREKLNENNDETNILGHTMNDKSFSLINTIIDILDNESLEKIKRTILNLLSESTTYSKSSQEMKYQACFAIKSGINGLLDVARKTYLQTIEEIYELANTLSEQDSIPIKVQYKTSRGYFFIIPIEIDNLPDHYIQSVQNKKTISCSTLELNSLSDRAFEKISQAIIITNELIQDCLSEIRNEIDGLFCLVDSVALLDMLVSFADLVTFSSQSYIRPILNESGPIIITESRHPILSSLRQLNTGYISNDIYINDYENFQIVTGPNGSGKTIYIKQVGLNIILAQIGSFVPATYCMVSIRDKILSRLGTSDDMENNLSTFSIEMKETAYILSNFTDKSLILIDELGRGTSNIDGLSLAIAISEKLINSFAYTFFVTHYSQITKLSEIYSNIKNIHLKTALEFINTKVITNPNEINEVMNDLNNKSSTNSKKNDETNKNSEENNQISIKFLHQLGSGPCDMVNGYGILLGQMSGFPPCIIENARVYHKILSEKFPLKIEQDFNKRKIFNEIFILLNQIKEILRYYDNNIQNYIEGNEKNIVNEIDGNKENQNQSQNQKTGVNQLNNKEIKQKIESHNNKIKIKTIKKLKHLQDSISPDKLAMMLSALNS